MSKTVINFKVDREIKDEAQKLAKEFGVPLSAIVNAQLRELIRTRELNLSALPKMTPHLERILGEIERDRKNNKRIRQTRNVEEAIKHLDSL